MEGVLWYVLTGTRGGANRVRLVRAIDERPRNANQLAEGLDLDYKTVRHHLDVLVKHELVEIEREEYGSRYAPSAKTERNWDEVERIIRTVS